MKRQETVLRLLLALTILFCWVGVNDVKAQSGSSDQIPIPAAANSAGVTGGELAQGAGRVFMGQLFIVSGLRKIGNFAGTAARMASAGLPAAEALLVPTIGLEVGAGLALALNWYPDWAAGALSAFVVPVTLIFHNFWAIPNAAEAMQQQQLFLRNVAILGGLLTVAGQSENH